MEDNWLTRKRFQKSLFNISLVAFLRSFDKLQVQSVFKVFEAPGDRPEYVVLLKEDKGHMCTCMKLQNAGIVCRHFFLLQRHGLGFQYHISLIPRRWFHERHQGLKDSQLSVQPFLSSNYYKATSTLPSSDYMSTIHAHLPSKPQPPVLTEEEASRTWRHSDMSGKGKKIFDSASNSTEVSDLVRRELDILERKVFAAMSGTVPVEDPVDVSGAGRFRTKRITSWIEGARKGTKAAGGSRKRTKAAAEGSHTSAKKARHGAE